MSNDTPEPQRPEQLPDVGEPRVFEVVQGAHLATEADHALVPVEVLRRRLVLRRHEVKLDAVCLQPVTQLGQRV